jgi:hypothetical protein
MAGANSINSQYHKPPSSPFSKDHITQRWTDSSKNDMHKLDTYIPMVVMHKLEWTRRKVEQLASTRATSDIVKALPNTERPGHP